MVAAVDELSALSPTAAGAVADELRAVAGSVSGTGADVAAVRGGLTSWTGPAREAFDGRTAQLEQHLDVVTRTATAGAAVVEEWAARLGMFQGRLRTVDTALADVERRLADPALDPVRFGAAWSEREHWEAGRAALLADVDDASRELAARLRALVADVPDRPRTLGEHVHDAADVLVGAASATAFAALGWTWDPRGWWSSVRAAPGAALDSARLWVDDPRRAWRESGAAQLLDDARDGRWGAVAGAGAAAAVGRGIEKVVPELPEAPGKGGDSGTGDPDAPRRGAGGKLPPQSLDEMLAGVDLSRSEGKEAGHTIARHVDVDDAFLKRRLDTGQVEDGTRPRAPRVVSRWTDLETAERLITDTLRRNEEVLREAKVDRRGFLTVTGPAPPSAGTAWTVNGDDAVRVPVSGTKVVLRRNDEGTWTVHTAYVVTAAG